MSEFGESQGFPSRCGKAMDKGSWYSVTPCRSYKQGDETWKETDSLGFDDLLTMAKLIDQAHSWISRQVQADSTARKARKEANSDAA
jgi:hypothetical protein